MPAVSVLHGRSDTTLLGWSSLIHPTCVMVLVAWLQWPAVLILSFEFLLVGTYG